MVQFLTTSADEDIDGMFYSSKAYNAEQVRKNRLEVFACGTTRLAIELNNIADRGATARGLNFYLQPRVLTDFEKASLV